MKKFLLTIFFLTLVLLAVACSKQSVSFKNISAPELKKMLEQENFIMIDVHIPEQRHIPNTDLVIPYNKIEQNQTKLPADKSQKIVVYCRSGSMSKEASEKLADLGYTNVYNLKGGIYAWTAAGYATE